MANPVPTHEPRKTHIIDENSANDEIQIDLIAGYAQQVDFGVAAPNSLIIDEPSPLGDNTGPSPTRVLAAALASCLGASLLFCLKKSRVDVLGMRTNASIKLKRNEQGRLRVDSINVRLAPTVALDQQPNMARCLEVFEDYCIVTASVRPNITVNVSVNPVDPATLHSTSDALPDESLMKDHPAKDSLKT
ncbi:MAG: OsmC family protein [Gemmatimonadaceae bacterium]